MRISERIIARGKTFVLALHRILPAAENADSYNPHIVLTPEALKESIIALRELGRIVPLHEALEGICTGRRSQATLFALTFDDGWEDNFRCAFPILAQLAVPATIFLATEYIGTRKLLPEERWWQIWTQAETAGRLGDLKKLTMERDLGIVPEQCSHRYIHELLKNVPLNQKLEWLTRLEERLATTLPGRSRFMTWEQVRDMHRAGIQFGSHTRSHCVLPVETVAIRSRQLLESKARIEQELGAGVAHFAYPNGRFDGSAMQSVRECGYTAAFTTVSATANGLIDSMAVPRVSLDDFVVNDGSKRFSAACLRLHLLRAAVGGNGVREY
jgi:peptidoglycan/xylan/chitin deacetylase (PgdA/CDA1 family)